MLVLGLRDRVTLSSTLEPLNWVAVKMLTFRDYPPIMENQMEKKMENEMETGGIWGLRNLILSYYIGETLLFTVYIPIMVT